MPDTRRAPTPAEIEARAAIERERREAIQFRDLSSLEVDGPGFHITVNTRSGLTCKQEGYGA